VSLADATTSDTEVPTTTVAPTTTAPPPPPTTAPPTTAKPTTTTARPTTTTARPTTTTARPTTTTAAPTTTATPSSAQEGDASYYYPSDPAECAHRTLPFGTSVTVTNLENGKRTTCVVGDRGPFVDGRVIDLSSDRFAELAPLSEGVIRVRIEW
jgi:rare lipoprotein A